MKNKLLYFLRVGAVWYIKGVGMWQGHCDICGKRRKTTTHHLIPRKIHKICKNENLKEMVVRACKDCHELMHPENRLIRKDQALKILANKNDRLSDGPSWRAMRLNAINTSFRKIKVNSEDMIRKINELLKMSDENFKKQALENRKKKEEKLKTKLKGGKKENE